jgi:tRNA/tmRNA/rRNA uracil-C5-methylase (TrmA/RlmC/RlmD family)
MAVINWPSLNALRKLFRALFKPLTKKEKHMGLFTVHAMNEKGENKLIEVQDSFESLEEQLKEICETTETMENAKRSLAVVKTKLDEACMWAKKAIELQKRYQVRE